MSYVIMLITCACWHDASNNDDARVLSNSLVDSNSGHILGPSLAAQELFGELCLMDTR